MCCKTKKCFGGASLLTVLYANEYTPKIENIHTLTSRLSTGRKIKVLSRRGWDDLVTIEETGHADTFQLPHWTLLLTAKHKLTLTAVGGGLDTIEKYPHAIHMGRAPVYDVITTGKDILAGPYIVQVTKATAKQILERGNTACSKKGYSPIA
jgi:hypothetical protein